MLAITMWMSFVASSFALPKNLSCKTHFKSLQTIYQHLPELMLYSAHHFKVSSLQGLCFGLCHCFPWCFLMHLAAFATFNRRWLGLSTDGFPFQTLSTIQVLQRTTNDYTVSKKKHRVSCYHPRLVWDTEIITHIATKLRQIKQVPPWRPSERLLRMQRPWAALSAW